MSRIFVATIPIENGEPQWGPVAERGNLEFERRGPRFSVRKVDPESSETNHKLIGYYLGRLDEGQFGTTGRPAVIVCTGSKGALTYLKNLAQGDANYNFRSLEEAWQITAVRNWLKTNGMPWIAGGFGPDPGSTYGRPTLPRVYCGQSHDIYAPEEP